MRCLKYYWGSFNFSASLEKQTLMGFYRFTRDYTEGVQGEWIINLLGQCNMLELRKRLNNEYKNVLSEKQ